MAWPQLAWPNRPSKAGCTGWKLHQMPRALQHSRPCCVQCVGREAPSSARPPFLCPACAGVTGAAKRILPRLGLEFYPQRTRNRYERGGVTAALVDAYRTPQLVRGWERGLLRFIAARVAGGGGLAASLRSRGADDERGGQAAELARVVAEHGIKARARPPAPGSAARLSWGEGGGESVCDRMMCLHAPA